MSGLLDSFTKTSNTKSTGSSHDSINSSVGGVSNEGSLNLTQSPSNDSNHGTGTGGKKWRRGGVSIRKSFL